MANNDRKQLSKFVAPRWGAIIYVFIFLSLSTSYGGAPQKSTKSRFNKVLITAEIFFNVEYQIFTNKLNDKTIYKSRFSLF